MRFGASIVLFSMLILLNTFVCRSASIDDVVRSEVSKAIMWDAFWDGAETLGANYEPGVKIGMRVVRTQNRIYAILGPIQLVVDIAISGSGHRVQAVRIVRPASTANAKAAEWFFHMNENANSGCVAVGTKTPNLAMGSSIPTSRPCRPPSLKILSDETLSFTLPALVPPEAVQKKMVPDDKNALMRAVRKHWDSEMQACGPLNAKIPFYSDTDPRVYVLISPAADCSLGVASFSRALDSKWEFGKFIMAPWNEQFSGLIAKIESHTAITLH